MYYTAPMAYEDGELTEDMVDLLQEYAEKVLAHWRENHSPG